jgi:TetR/AcrR family transcriptional repressor of lmrAB and yxaGH operons
MKTPTPPSEDTRGTRERLIDAMFDALQCRGFHGVGLNEVLAQADAPKGVLYHHFPGGKTELAVAAIENAVAHIQASFTQLYAREGDALRVLQAWLGYAQKQLEQSGFERGCPFAAVALESTVADSALRGALAKGFAAIRNQLAAMLTESGVRPPRATQLALLIVAAYEGGLMQARVAGHLAPLKEVCDTLLSLVANEQNAGAPA